MRSLPTAAAAAAALLLAGPALAQGDVVRGVGTAPVTKDVNAVRALAEDQARLALVRQMLSDTLGAERLREVSPAQMAALASQIGPSMIVSRSGEKVGNEFRVTMEARVDKAWFQDQVQNQNIRLSSEVAQSDTQPILVMMEETVAAARDLQAPAEVVTSYSRDSGAVFSDTSQAAYSEKDRSASSSASAASLRAAGSSSAGYSGRYGSAAGASRGAVAASAASRSASASSHSEAGAVKMNVQAAAHDRTSFYQRTVYQKPPEASPAGMAQRAMRERLRAYGVEMAEAEKELNTFFQGAPPTFSVFKASPRFTPFLNDVARRNVAPFFMGGTFRFTDAGRDPATGQAVCTGTLEAYAYATGSAQSVADAGKNDRATGITYEDCTANLAQRLALTAGDSMGPQIQRYWRTKLRRSADVVQASSGPAEWTLTIRAAQLDMATQADLMAALSGVPGVESRTRVSQGPREVSYQVRYSGSDPLDMALYEKLRANPSFTKAQATTNGRAITFCLSGC